MTGSVAPILAATAALVLAPAATNTVTVVTQGAGKVLVDTAGEPA